VILEINAKHYFPHGLIAIYGEVAAIGFEIQATQVTAETIPTTRFREDWLPFFSPHRGSTVRPE
jgi:hypothetical protein